MYCCMGGDEGKQQGLVLMDATASATETAVESCWPTTVQQSSEELVALLPPALLYSDLHIDVIGRLQVTSIRL